MYCSAAYQFYVPCTTETKYIKKVRRLISFIFK
jgi:hypothetical protein